VIRVAASAFASLGVFDLLGVSDQVDRGVLLHQCGSLNQCLPFAGVLYTLLENGGLTGGSYDDYV